MEMMSLVISFIEMTSIFLIYNVLINGDIKKNICKKILLSVVISLIYFIFTNIYYADPLIILIGILFLNSMIISKQENKDTIVTYIEFIVSSIILLGVELIVSLIVYVSMGSDDLSPFMYLIILVFTMSIVIYLLSTSKAIKQIEFSKLFSKYKSINIIILNLFVFFLFIKVLMSNKIMNTKIMIPITILGLILIGVNCYFYVFLYKILSEKKKKEIKKSFNPLINDLISKLKANEHEYKNHLNILYCMIQVCKEDELKDKAKKYIGNVFENKNLLNNLSKVENTILKAVLLSKINQAEKNEIDCYYFIDSQLEGMPLDDSELTVVLSNLLNNAIEAASKSEKKVIEISTEYYEGKYIIEVSNSVDNLTKSMVADISKIRFSTKGTGRGYGLYNVKNIVEKYKGKVNMSLEEDIFNVLIEI